MLRPDRHLKALGAMLESRFSSPLVATSSGISSAMRRSTSAVVLAMCAPLWYCGGGTSNEQSPREYGLEITAVYGWADLADSTRALSDLERRYEGAVLANPTGIAEGRDGRVFVLDAGFKKIVIFSPRGEFLGLITGGAGEGPGEFQFPNQIVVGPGGDFWISDLQLQRISRFSPDGELIATIPAPGAVTPRMMSISATDSILYAVRVARDSVPVLIAMDSTGAVLGELVWPSSEDIRFGGSRLAVGVGKGPDGSLVLAHTDVGTWSRVHGLIQSDRRGRSFYPEATPWEKIDPRYGIRTTQVAAQPSHAGGFSDGMVFLRFLENRTNSHRFKLALFDSAGALLSILDSAGSGGAFGHSVVDKNIYFVENAPFPRVHRAAVVEKEIN